MNKIDFKNAYYIKLGEKGIWAKSSIADGILRFDWSEQTIEDINQGRWDVIREQIKKRHPQKATATYYFNSLKHICQSTEDDIWITFYSSKLWWCRVEGKRTDEDDISKFRKVKERWFDHDINGKVLKINGISGRLSKTQGSPKVLCQVSEKDDLRQHINNEPSAEYIAIEKCKKALIEELKEGLKRLYWKDFEIFVDLLFRQSGWQRLGNVGGIQEYVDIDLEDPITHDQYQVQVKSRATVSDLKEYSDKFSAKDHRKLYFVVHTPDSSLLAHKQDNTQVEVWLPNQIAEMAVNLGLVNWLMNKI